jgi:hypothetical protein
MANDARVVPADDEASRADCQRFLDAMFGIAKVAEALNAVARDGVVLFDVHEDVSTGERTITQASRPAGASSSALKIIDEMLRVDEVVIAMSTLAEDGRLEIRLPEKSADSIASCYALSLDPESEGEKSQDVFEPTLAGDVPICEGCAQPMTALAILHRHPKRLPLTKHAALGVFVCSREAGDNWDAWWSACAIANPKAKGGLAAVLYGDAPKAKSGKPAYYTVSNDQDEDDEDEPLRGSKLGGKPRWSGAIDPPAEGHGAWNRPMKCPECDELMRYVGQIEAMSELDFEVGDGFNIYLFLCKKEHAARLNCLAD